MSVCAGISQLAACRVPLLHKLGLGKSYAGDFLIQSRRFASIRLICCTFPLECAVKRFTALIPTRSGFFLCFVEGVCDPAWMRLITILCLCSHHQTSGCVCCWVLVLKRRAIFKRRSTLLNSLEVYGCAIFKNSTSEISVDFSVHLEENSSLLYVKIAYMGRWFAQPDF